MTRWAYLMVSDSNSNETPKEELPKTIAHRDVDSPLDVTESWQELLEPCDRTDSLGTLGHFQVLEFVGRGGMGIVFRAWDLKLQRYVAIKVMSPVLAQDGLARKRFLREARTAASISDVNVVSVFSVHEENVPPYLVMEFVDGLSLEELIAKQGPLDLKTIVQIGTQIALGLAAAHAQGLVHRDIKPANVLIEAGDRVKVSDFGLARSADDAGMTRTGQIAGTPDFMSPEQAEGREIDHRTDIFSLGSVLYAMCVGHPPFQSDSALVTLRRVCDADPSPVRSLRPDTPEWLERAIAWLMNKDPSQRPQSAIEVARIIKSGDRGLDSTAVLSSSKTDARQETELSRSFLRRLTRDRRFWLASVAVITVVGLFLGLQASESPPVKGAKLWPKEELGNGHWYVAKYVPGGISWDEAHAEAIAMGGHLVTINSRDEDDFVVRLLQSDDYWITNTTDSFYQGPWIGAIQIEGAREPDGGWRWITGEEFTFSNWHFDKELAHSQPNDGLTAYIGQNKIFYHVRGRDYLKAGWGDATTDSSIVRSFVVEFDDKEIVETHPQEDSYVSLVVDGGKGAERTGLIVSGIGDAIAPRSILRSDFDLRRTIFIPPGQYDWQLLDLSADRVILKNGTMTVKAGQRVTFTRDKGPEILDP